MRLVDAVLKSREQHIFDLDSKDSSSGNTALHYAAMSNQYEVSLPTKAHAFSSFNLLIFVSYKMNKCSQIMNVHLFFFCRLHRCCLYAEQM